VPLEQKLEHADVVAAHAAPDDPGSEEQPSASAEGGPRSGPGDAVDDEAVPALERADGADGLRPLNGVDRPRIEATLTQSDLEPGDLRVEAPCRGGERERDQKSRDREGQAAHVPRVGTAGPGSCFQLLRIGLHLVFLGAGLLRCRDLPTTPHGLK
jgi:hypothetical protein